MGGRGAWAKRTNPYRSGTRAALAREGVQLTGGGGGVGDVSDAKMIASALGSETFPQIKNFSESKNIVDFNFRVGAKSGSITIKDDLGRTFTGKYENEGASRITFAFKEGFVMKFDGLKSAGFAPGAQTRQEVDLYNNINKALIKPARQFARGDDGRKISIKQKNRVPDLVNAYFKKTVTVGGRTYKGVAVSFMSRAKGGHDTGIKFNTPKGKQLVKRVNQYLAALRKRGVSTNDIRVLPRGYKSDNIYLHNMYRDKKTGKIMIVDIGY